MLQENGYQLLFLSARAISQAYHTRQFLLNLKQVIGWSFSVAWWKYETLGLAYVDFLQLHFAFLTCRMEKPYLMDQLLFLQMVFFLLCTGKVFGCSFYFPNACISLQMHNIQLQCIKVFILFGSQLLANINFTGGPLYDEVIPRPILRYYTAHCYP